ncbi:MAG: DHH family phosphoesterase, partial [Acidobacteriaceae bacterium]
MTEPTTTERRTPASPAANDGRLETPARETPGLPITAVLEAIRQRQRFLLTSHCRPDGDAVGSLLALWMTLNAMGKQAEMQLYDPVPVIY